MLAVRSLPTPTPSSNLPWISRPTVAPGKRLVEEQQKQSTGKRDQPGPDAEEAGATADFDRPATILVRIAVVRSDFDGVAPPSKAAALRTAAAQVGLL
jgi:hypothetical protein